MEFGIATHNTPILPSIKMPSTPKGRSEKGGGGDQTIFLRPELEDEKGLEKSVSVFLRIEAFVFRPRTRLFFIAFALFTPLGKQRV